MKLFPGSFFVGLFALSLGCTKGIPTFQNLDGTIPQPLFSGSTTKSYLTMTSTQTFDVSGQCDEKIRELVATPVGVNSTQSTLAAMVTSGITVNCATNGTFSFQLKSLADLGFTLVDNSNYEIQLRGVTSGGISEPSTIRILYSTTGGAGPKRVVLTSGGTETTTSGERLATSANFKAEVRLDHRMNTYSTVSDHTSMTEKSSTSFKFKSGAAAANN